jgi:hypothetical protein
MPPAAHHMSDFFGIKVIKRDAIMFPLAQHGVPTQPCLGSFQDEELEQAPVIVNGHSPFAVVIIDVILFGEINPRTTAATNLFLHRFLSIYVSTEAAS